jgi:hypothetical protein
VDPSADGLGIASPGASGAVDEFGAIFRVGEIAHVEAKHPPVFVNFHHVAVNALAHRNSSLLEHFRIARDIVLIDPRSGHVQ